MNERLIENTAGLTSRKQIWVADITVFFKHRAAVLPFQSWWLALAW